MGVLDNVFAEEYDRISRMIDNISAEIESLPKGYVSKKKINGNEYYYLQKRQGDKITFSYLVKEKVADYKTLIDRRRELEKQKRRLEKDKKKLSRVIGGEDDK